MNEELDECTKACIKDVREDATLSEEDKQRYERLLIEKVKVCKQIDEIDRFENPIMSKTASSMAEKHAIMRDELSEMFEDIINELAEYFDIDDEGAEPIKINATPSKVLNEMIGVYVTHEMETNTRWRRLNKQDLEKLVKTLPEEELKLLPDQSSNSYALLLKDINNQISGYQFDVWNESRTVARSGCYFWRRSDRTSEKREHEPLNEEQEKAKKRARLELLEKIMPEWSNMADNEDEDDDASSIGSESETDCDQYGENEQEECEDLTQEQTELPTQSDHVDEETADQLQSNSDNSIENLEPTSSSNDNRTQKSTSVSNHNQFMKLLDQYEQDTNELLRVVEEFGEDIDISSSSEDEVVTKKTNQQ